MGISIRNTVTWPPDCEARHLAGVDASRTTDAAGPENPGGGSSGTGSEPIRNGSVTEVFRRNHVGVSSGTTSPAQRNMHYTQGREVTTVRQIPPGTRNLTLSAHPPTCIGGTQ